MAKCKVCKQEILPTDMVVESGDIHKNGACDTYYNETKQRPTHSPLTTLPGYKVKEKKGS